jgi:hypothetical protein
VALQTGLPERAARPRIEVMPTKPRGLANTMRDHGTERARAAVVFPFRTGNPRLVSAMVTTIIEAPAWWWGCQVFRDLGARFWRVNRPR